MTTRRFGPPSDSSIDEDERLTPAARIDRDAVIASHYTFRPDEELARRLADLPSLSETRTDAVSAVEQHSEDEEWLARWVIADQGGATVARSLTLEPLGRATPP